MTENGVAALNLTQVASRVGLRQPSLYQYFPSRTAVYDALFARGMRQQRDLQQAAIAQAEPGWPGVRAAMVVTVRFSMEVPVLAQLLFTRAVPGFTPSEEAYRPSVEAIQAVQTAMAQAVTLGHLHSDAGSERGLALLVAVVAGVASQQLANDPDSSFEEGRFSGLVEPALDMYASYLSARGSGLDGAMVVPLR